MLILVFARVFARVFVSTFGALSAHASGIAGLSERLMAGTAWPLSLLATLRLFVFTLR